MAFWSSETFQQQGELQAVVSPFSPGRISRGAYELSLGKEAYSTSSKDGKKTILKEGEQFVIPPGQFAMLLTEEAVKIPDSAIGLISIKAGIKFRGLVNVSGFHVDPGYSGKLKFSVYNAGSKNIVLDRNQPVFLLWINNLDVPTKDLYPSLASNNEITAADVMNIQGEVASPAELKKSIDSLRTELRIYQGAIGLIIAILLAFWGISVKTGSKVDRRQPAVENISTSVQTMSAHQAGKDAAQGKSEKRAGK